MEEEGAAGEDNQHQYSESILKSKMSSAIKSKLGAF
jgi:hypothetical protein